MRPDASHEVFAGTLIRVEVETWGGRACEVVRRDVDRAARRRVLLGRVV